MTGGVSDSYGLYKHQHLQLDPTTMIFPSVAVVLMSACVFDPANGQYGMRSHPIYMGNPGPASEPIPGPFLPVLPIVPRLSPYTVFRMPPVINANPVPIVSNSLAPAKNHRLADQSEMSQFQSQDSDGRFVFGFNTADQSRVEARSADGTVRGSYSYTDPMGKQVQAQYWDTGAGFHITGNNVMSSDSGHIQDTPEVEQARNEHLQLYQQTLASIFNNNKFNEQINEADQFEDDQRDDGSPPKEENEQVIVSTAEPSSAAASSAAIVADDETAQQITATNSSTANGNATAAVSTATVTATTTTTTSTERSAVPSQDADWTNQEYDDDTVIVDNPNLMRIAWSTDGSYRYAKRADSRDKKSVKMFGDRLVPLKSYVKRV
ncbi:uncharacterized protein LOC126846944 [Adelges cooleyi]|uniref:uncharacterized protein LOC126846944 n=1 Tax=Adelges cooleyi TaxID=133065 RepID=UPI00217FC33B|nr:uncharacterized protein LOC126846944 [Adelges cooleyi]